MMAQAAPLLLLPFLLMGSQEQVFQMKYKEGQTLRVYCSYKLRRDENSLKTWCKLQENGRLCDRLITRTSVFLEQLRNARVSLLDDTSTGTIIITMSNLTVGDSGMYWCGIYYSAINIVEPIETIILEVAPATILKTTKHSQPTTKTPLTTSGTPLATISPRDNQKFIIWGSVLVILLLVGLLSAGIAHAVKISRKQWTGDDDGHHVYDDLEKQKKKARDITTEMQEEGSEVIQYASLMHATQLSLGDSIYANTQMGHNPGSTHIPREPVEYVSIARPGCQLPK